MLVGPAPWTWTRTAVAEPADMHDHPVIAERVGIPVAGAIGELLRGELPAGRDDEAQQDEQAK